MGKILKRFNVYASFDDGTLDEGSMVSVIVLCEEDEVSKIRHMMKNHHCYKQTKPSGFKEFMVIDGEIRKRKNIHRMKFVDFERFWEQTHEIWKKKGNFSW